MAGGSGSRKIVNIQFRMSKLKDKTAYCLPPTAN